MEQKLPAVVITNYQQYIDAGYLVDMLLAGDDLKGDSKPLYASVAYVDVKKLPRLFKGQRMYNIVLALSIKGKTYTYKKVTDNTNYFLAKVGLDTNSYGTAAGKDNHIRVLQKAFEEVVSHFIEKISIDIALNQPVNMKSVKKFKIVHEFYTYSKKKGTHSKRVIVAKDISSFEEAVDLIKQWHPNAIMQGNIARNVGGLLYPHSYEIK